MSSEAGETSAKDVEQLLERIRKLCGKIPVAKKETLQLAELCDTLGGRLSDRFQISQKSNYDEIKSDLVKVEGQLACWSKFCILRSLWKKADIEAGVIGFVEALEVWVPKISEATAIQGTHTPGEGASEVQVPSLNPPEIQDIQSVQASEAPPIKRLDGEVTKLKETPLAKGRYCETWEGQWVNESGEKLKVALKALQTETSEDGPKVLEILERELKMWEELRHQNILPFYGIVTDIEPRIHMVSPWQENGNLLDYIKSTPEPNKKYLLRGTAAGLSYLHSRSIVHGSVNCKNVLVSDEGEPQICDIGIARISEEINGAPTSKTMLAGGYVRYMAPELIEDSSVPATTHSDTYSFAMLILECITERVPFSNIRRDTQVIHAKTTKKQFPLRPEGPEWDNHAPEGLWELMMRCWAVRPDERPTMGHVHSFFLHRA